MSYEVIVPGPVQKQLAKLPEKVSSRIFRELRALEANPRPAGCEKLAVEMHGAFASVITALSMKSTIEFSPLW
jgi:mRNA-degrading endonuclease RelE of RelBE toxin-antitoxin system